MQSMNRVTVMGHLTTDPQLRRAGEHDVCNLSLALNRSYNDASGQKKEETTFVDLEAWGPTAQTLSRFFHKGDPILIEGRLKQDRWQDGQGRNRSRLKLVVDRFHFVSRAAPSSKTRESGKADQAAPAEKPAQAPARQSRRQLQTA